LGIETNVSNILSFQENGCVQASSLNHRGKRTPLNYILFAIQREILSVLSRILPWDKGHLIYINIDRGK
jgi:hypothetical protein